MLPVRPRMWSGCRLELIALLEGRLHSICACYSPYLNLFLSLSLTISH